MKVRNDDANVSGSASSVTAYRLGWQCGDASAGFAPERAQDQQAMQRDAQTLLISPEDSSLFVAAWLLGVKAAERVPMLRATERFLLSLRSPAAQSCRAAARVVPGMWDALVKLRKGLSLTTTWKATIQRLAREF